MALPVVNNIEFFTKIPSTKQEIKFTPFTVKQQKNMLIARESQEDQIIVNAVLNVLKECIQEDLDYEKLASFDIQYLFLQIRGKSIGEVIEFKIPHWHNEECNMPIDLKLNVEEVGVTFPEGHTNKIQINDQYGMVIKYPSVKGYEAIKDEKNSVEANLKFIAASIEMVYDNEKVYDDFTFDEAYNFLMTLTTEQLQKVTNFYETLPYMYHKIEFDCPHCNQHDIIEFRSLADFFMLG